VAVVRVVAVAHRISRPGEAEFRSESGPDRDSKGVTAAVTIFVNSVVAIRSGVGREPRTGRGRSLSDPAKNSVRRG